MQRRYDYFTMPVTAVLGLTALGSRAMKDAYVADDQESQAYNQLLKAGFRWVRTDGDIAVFERDNTEAMTLEESVA